MQKYRASNRVPFLTFLLLIIVGAAAAIGVGLALFAAEYYLSIYLIVLFPILAGAIVGGILAWVARAGKARSPFLVALVGLAAGVLIFATYHFASYYIGFRSEARAAYIENTGKTPTDTQLDNELNLILEDEVGAGGFVGYLQLVAREGFSITRAVSSSSSSGIELTNELVYAYWVIEILVGVAFTTLLPRRAAAEPFDEDDNVWYGKPTLVGIAPGNARKPLIEALERSDFQGAGRMLTRHDLKYPRTELMIRRSPVHNAMPQDVYVTVNQVQRQGRSTVVRKGIISPTEMDWIVRAMEEANGFAAPPPAQPARRTGRETPSERFEF